jgi:hypothetical protein
VYEANTIELMGKPTVSLVNQGFANDARSSASNKGMPGIRFIPESVPCETTVAEFIEAGVTAVIDDIITALTGPLTAEEASPKSKSGGESARIVFKGTLGEINRYYYRRGWTDGLPVIPPTEETVAEMLTGTDLPADHLVGKLIPRLGKATVEKIAINAVMAGALPTYMPVLIAGVQALMDPESGFGVFGVSAGSWAPFWVINGPIRNSLRVNSGFGALSPGDIANASIGRSMGLIIKNLGGIRKAVEDMGSLGNPCKYSFVVAENEEESPWEPFHVEYGFNREDSAVSVSFPNNFRQGSGSDGDARGIIRGLLSGLTGPGAFTLEPGQAQILARDGWTKKEVKEFLCEYARIPASQSSAYTGRQAGAAPVVKDKHLAPLNPDETVPILRNPNFIKLIVAGGTHGAIGIFTGGHRAPVIKNVALPANWDKLVKKYQDIEPIYVLY